MCASETPLASPQPDFKLGQMTYSNCLLLHRLLVTGHGEKLLRRRQEISFSILSHTCQYKENSTTTKKVRNSFISEAIPPQVTALHLAAQFSSASVVKVFDESGAVVDAHDSDQETPLHIAARHNESSDVISALVAAGANVDARNDYQRTPLYFAAMSNKSSDVICALVKAGADIDASDNGQYTPLHDAARQNKSADVIRPLVEAGANVHARDGVQHTPLHLAAWNNKSADVIRVLVKAGADVDARDDDQSTPLHIAARHNPSAVKPLIDCGANVNLLNKYQRSPLYRAARWNQKKAINALCAAGADPLRLGQSPLSDPNVDADMKKLICHWQNSYL